MFTYDSHYLKSTPNASQLFEAKRGSKPIDPQSDPVRLYAKIGQLNMELDWLKKKSGISL